MKAIKVKNPIPVNPEGWLKEIARAYSDARDAIPFAELIDDKEKFDEKNIFHFAPGVCLKFRGIRKNKQIFEKTTEAALSSYVATQDHAAEIFQSPVMAFAFCFVAGHFGIGLITEKDGHAILAFVEAKQAELTQLINDEKNKYDAAWDNPGNRKAFHDKYCQWEKRQWTSWLKENLFFPFDVKRMEDEDDAYFTDVAQHEPFRLGHAFSVLGIGHEDDLRGVFVKVKEGRKTGHMPLCDIEVTSRYNPNYWPVKEYVVWFANR